MNRVKRTLIGLLIVLNCVGATTVYDAAQSPVCDAAGTKGWTFDVAPDLSFDHVSYFYDTDLGDSIQLKIREGGDGTNNFKFIRFDSNFKSANITDAADSSTNGIEFVAQVNEIIVVKDTTITPAMYYGYKYDPTSKTAITQVILQLPLEITNEVTKFIPFYWDAAALWVGISGGETQSAVFSYPWPLAQPWTSTPEIHGQIMTHEYQTISGNGIFFYDSAVPRIQHYSNDDLDYVDYLIGPCVTKAGVKVSAFALRQYYFSYAVMEGSLTNGTFYQIQGTDIVSTPIPLSTINLQGFTDSVSNVVIVTSAFFSWTTIIADGSFIHSHTDDTEMTLTGVKGIALSGNKAVILYEDKVAYYQHQSQGRIQKINQKTYTTTDLDLTTQNTWKISLSCKCLQVRIKSFSCFSSTINCMVVTKQVQVSCAISNDITP